MAEDRSGKRTYVASFRAPSGSGDVIPAAVLAQAVDDYIAGPRAGVVFGPTPPGDLLPAPPVARIVGRDDVSLLLESERPLLEGAGEGARYAISGRVLERDTDNPTHIRRIELHEVSIEPSNHQYSPVIRRASPLKNNSPLAGG